MMKRQTTFGVLFSNRSFFPAHVTLAERERLLRVLEQEGHRVVALGLDDTKNGA